MNDWAIWDSENTINIPIAATRLNNGGVKIIINTALLLDLFGFPWIKSINTREVTIDMDKIKAAKKAIQSRLFVNKYRVSVPFSLLVFIF